MDLEKQQQGGVHSELLEKRSSVLIVASSNAVKASVALLQQLRSISKNSPKIDKAFIFSKSTGSHWRSSSPRVIMEKIEGEVSYR